MFFDTLKERESACRGQAHALDWPYLKFGVCKRATRVLFSSLLERRWEHSMKHPPGEGTRWERGRENEKQILAWERWGWEDNQERDNEREGGGGEKVTTNIKMLRDGRHHNKAFQEATPHHMLMPIMLALWAIKGKTASFCCLCWPTLRHDAHEHNRITSTTSQLQKQDRPRSMWMQHASSQTRRVLSLVIIEWEVCSPKNYK